MVVAMFSAFAFVLFVLTLILVGTLRNFSRALDQGNMILARDFRQVFWVTTSAMLAIVLVAVCVAFGLSGGS